MGTDNCEKSKKKSQKTITIKQAIENETIPYEKCTRKQGCACIILMRAKRDINGKLIRKIK